RCSQNWAVPAAPPRAGREPTHAGGGSPSPREQQGSPANRTWFVGRASRRVPASASPSPASPTCSVPRTSGPARSTPAESRAPSWFRLQKGAEVLEAPQHQHAHVPFRDAHLLGELRAAQPLEELAEQDLTPPLRQPLQGSEQVQHIIGMLDRLQ